MDEQQSFDFDSSDVEKDFSAKLKMDRPIVFFDLETTGLDIKIDRIVQFALIRLNIDKSTDEWMEFVNPEIPIPPEASRIHKITDEMVKDKPNFEYFAPNMIKFLENCDLAGFNSLRFDLPFLQSELQRYGQGLDLSKVRNIDVQTIYHKKEPRDLTAAYKFYCNQTLEDAHDALADVRATIAVFDGQLRRYKDLPHKVESLHDFCNTNDDDRWVTQDRKFLWRNNEAVFAFGKHKSKSLQWVFQNDLDYLLWLKDQEFSDETRALLNDALKGIYPHRAE